MSEDFFAHAYGVDQQTYETLLREGLSRGGDYCELFFQQSFSATIGLEDGKVCSAHRSADVGIGIRVVAGDCTGYAFSEELELASMLDAARIAAGIADGGKTIEPQPITHKRTANYYPVERWWSDVSLDERLPLLEQVERRAVAADSRVLTVRANLVDAESHVLVVNSLGDMRSDHRPLTLLKVSCVASDGVRREENGFNLSGRHGREFWSEQTLHAVADEAVARTTLLFEARRPEAGEMPVVMAAGSSGILLHEAIGHGMEADFNRKGISIYADALGQSIADRSVSIVDDGTVLASRGAINVDDEGCDSQRTVLVENGVLRSYMHDRISALHYGVEPTGNGRRQSFRYAPLPRMRCTYMESGPYSPEEIIKTIDRGIYAQTFTNGQVRIGAGDFTFYVKSGYLIENGKLTAPIKDVNLIGNGPEVLKKVVMVGDDMKIDSGGWTCGKNGQSVPVSIGMPTVKVSAITVGGVS
ncbi:MAG: TldD/PmbA family protein [Deltaproteobacteria bacterium]|nr:TldD/PmbA family protein [Deltaproteobacteria bacterium]